MNIWRGYQPHEMLVAPARAQSAWWRFAAGLMLAFVVYVVINQAFFAAVYTLTRDSAGNFYDDLMVGATPFSMQVLLFSFAFMTMGIGITVRLLHNRSLLSVLGPLPLLWTDFRRVSVMMVVLLLVLAVLPPWDMGGDYVRNTPLGLWLVLLPVSLLAVLVQVSAEEIVFRGYIQQQLAARFKSPLVWMILPAALFALGHYLPAEAGENALTIAIWAGVFGVLMADLTARSGSLGPAIAVHLWNNVSAILIVGLPDNLGGLALFHAPFSMDDTATMKAWLPVDFALMFVSWIAARLAIRR
jgi:membrane protease YdiL (CAAX protease family)